MPALRISVDGVDLATVCTDGCDVLDVRVDGTCIDDAPAVINVSGLERSDSEDPVSRTWIDHRPLRMGQQIIVSFLASAVNSHPRKTIQELFPKEAPDGESDFAMTAEKIAEIGARPKLREKYSFRISSSSGASLNCASAPEDHGFSFSVLWISRFHPECARTSLRCYTLDGLGVRDAPLEYLFRENIFPEGQITFEIVA